VNRKPVRDVRLIAPQQANFYRGKVSEMKKSLETKDAALMIIALKEYIEPVLQTELDRISRRLVVFRYDRQDPIEELSRGIVNTILRRPITALEAASTDEEAAALLNLLPRIFPLVIKAIGKPSPDHQEHSSDSKEAL
jgi:glutamyl-tRNA reductase